MATDAQKRASAKYRREKVRQVGISFYPAEADLYEWVKAQPNMSGYIKGLIRDDMETEGRSKG